LEKMGIGDEEGKSRARLRLRALVAVGAQPTGGWG
jgi:hypothetical protein